MPCTRPCQVAPGRKQAVLCGWASYPPRAAVDKRYSAARGCCPRELQAYGPVSRRSQSSGRGLAASPHGSWRSQRGRGVAAEQNMLVWVGRVRDALDEKLSSSAHSIDDLRSGATSI
jgi:hypothetical protein